MIIQNLEVYLYLDENLFFELLKLCGQSKDHSTAMMRLEIFVEENLSLVQTFDTGPGWTMEATGSGSDHGWLL